MTTQAVSKFIKQINKIDASKHRGEVFRDFCELAYCALAKKASPFPGQQNHLEEQYMSVVGRYQDKDDIRRMPELLSLAMLELSSGGSDFLGTVAAELGILDARLGQFFTPFELSRLMAEINFKGIDEVLSRQGFVTVQEPAAGAGGMLLALADVVESKGYDLETSVWVEATELSRNTYHMCYVQVAARGLAGRIINGNTLSLEVQTSAYTMASHHFIAANGLPFENKEKQATAVVVEREPGLQLDLFAA